MYFINDPTRVKEGAKQLKKNTKFNLDEGEIESIFDIIELDGELWRDVYKLVRNYCENIGYRR